MCENYKKSLQLDKGYDKVHEIVYKFLSCSKVDDSKDNRTVNYLNKDPYTKTTQVNKYPHTGTRKGKVMI